MSIAHTLWDVTILSLILKLRDLNKPLTPSMSNNISIQILFAKKVEPLCWEKSLLTMLSASAIHHSESKECKKGCENNQTTPLRGGPGFSAIAVIEEERSRPWVDRVTDGAERLSKLSWRQRMV